MLRKWTTAPLLLPLLMLCASAARAQDKPAAPAVEPAENGRQVIESIEKEQELVLSGKGGYNYDPAGRRDPFVNPLSAQEAETEQKARPEGWPGMLIGEVELKGVTVYGGEPIAIFLGTDGMGYFAREGDELWDGKIIAIGFEEKKVVFQQKVEDPQSPIRYREVFKTLTP